MDILISSDSIQRRISSMAIEINNCYKQYGHTNNTQEPLIVIGIMDGALLFMSDLIKKLSINIKLDFMKVSSFHRQVDNPTPVVTSWPANSIYNKNILLIDDILDRGKTIELVQKCLFFMGAKDIKTAVLLEKNINRDPDIKVDFVGFGIPNELVAGYGMDDHNGLRREIQYIFVDVE